MRNDIHPNQISLFDSVQNRGVSRERERELKGEFIIYINISFPLKIYSRHGENFYAANENAKISLNFPYTLPIIFYNFTKNLETKHISTGFMRLLR